jgi:AmiR/NasT family two-component response regulator
VEELQRTIDQLENALVTNRTTATAVGVLMERHALEREAAWQLLVRMSQDSNTKLVVVAEEILRPGTG